MNAVETANALELLKQVSVLYVEDDLAVRDQLAQFIRRRVANLHLAANGQEGLEAYHRLKPGIVVTDISMPVMNGLEMARYIKADNFDTPVIVTTAYNEVGFLNEAIEIGIDKYVVKPVNPKALMDALQTAVVALFHHREIEVKNRMVQFLVDNHPTYQLAVACSNLGMVKDDILRHLGYASHEEMQEQCGDDFFNRMDGVIYPQTENGGWIDQLIQHPGVEHILYLVDGQPRRARAFILSFNRFDEVDQCLFSFTEIPASRDSSS